MSITHDKNYIYRTCWTLLVKYKTIEKLCVILNHNLSESHSK